MDEGMERIAFYPLFPGSGEIKIDDNSSAPIHEISKPAKERVKTI